MASRTQTDRTKKNKAQTSKRTSSTNPNQDLSSENPQKRLTFRLTGYASATTSVIQIQRGLKPPADVQTKPLQEKRLKSLNQTNPTLRQVWSRSWQFFKKLKKRHKEKKKAEGKAKALKAQGLHRRRVSKSCIFPSIAANGPTSPTGYHTSNSPCPCCDRRGQNFGALYLRKSMLKQSARDSRFP